MLGSRRLFISVAAATAATLALGTVAAQADSLTPVQVSGMAAQSAASSAALATIQSRIARYVAVHGTAYTFGSYLDSTTGRIVLSTNAPASVVSSLTSMSTASAALQQATTRVQVRRSGPTDTYNRRDDAPAFSGGAGISSGGSVCSSGYTVTLNSAPTTRYMITAGHCYANGASVTSESGLNAYGTVSLRKLPTITGDPSDIEAIGGGVYAARIFTGSATSATSTNVAGTGVVQVNGFANYCASGRTTGENCGHTITSATAQLCTATGCKQPVIAFTGGTMIQSGDSAGPFYYYSSGGSTGPVQVVGHLLATDTVTGYVEPYTVTASELGVTLATS